jgi:glycosyltransferase involved in cell wall biosynthesis
MLRNAAAIQCLTEDDRRDIARLGYPCRLELIPNGAAVDSIRPPAPLEQETLRILFFSRIHPKKGTNIVVNAFIRTANSLPNSILLVVGPIGDQTYANECHSIVDQAGLGHRVLFLGPAYGDAKFDLFRSASLFVLPYSWSMA